MITTNRVGNEISQLTLEDLKKMSTIRVLNVKRIAYTYLSVTDDYVWDCDCSDCKCEKERYAHWEKMIENCKTVLASREHVESKGKYQKKS